LTLRSHEERVQGCGRPPFEGAARKPYKSGRHSLTELTPSLSHNSPRWWGWTPPRELAETAPGHDSQARCGAALPCESIKCPYTRAGAGALVREPRARRNPLEGGGDPRVRRTPLEGGGDPRARRTSLESGVSPRARRTSLEGAFCWAASVGRRGHRCVDRVVCIFCVRPEVGFAFCVFCRF
jgi:hypothetical protein